MVIYKNRLNYQVINQIVCPEKEGCTISVVIAYADRDQKYSSNTRGVFLTLMRMNCTVSVAHQVYRVGNLLITFLTCAPRS